VEGNVRICDFGGAKLRRSAGGDGEEADQEDLQASATFSYTPLWVAPEAISTGQYNEGADVWSLG
jgi:serine/threonine protein kinase